MSAQRRPATKRDTTATSERRAGGRPDGAAGRASTKERRGSGAGDSVKPSGAAVAAAPSRVAPASSSAPAKAAKPAAPRSKDAEPKQRAFAERGNRVKKVFDDTRAELKKITWPDRETTRNLTIVVIGISVALGIALGGIDYILFQIFEALP